MKKNSILKNSTFLLSSNVLVQASYFLFIVFLGRYLGSKALGIYSFGVALMNILMLITEFGINAYVLKEGQSKREILNDYVNIKLVVNTIVSFFVSFSIIISPYNQADKISVLLMVAAMYLFDLNRPFFSAYNSLERLEFESILKSCEALAVLVFSLILIKMGFGLNEIIATLIIIRVIVLVSNIAIYRRKIGKIKISFNVKRWYLLLKSSFYFWLMSIFSVVYFYFDSLMLSFMKGIKVNGWYNAGYKLSYAFAFIPVGILFVSFPVMSRLHKNRNKKELKLLINNIIKYLTIIITPLALAALFLGKQIIILVYRKPEFIKASLTFEILMLAEIFLFVNQISMGFLSAIDNEKKATKIVGIGVLLNIILNFILIPKYSLNGAAFATGFSEAAIFILFAYNIVSSNYKINILKAMTKPIISGIIMLFVMFLLFFKIANVYFISLTGGLVYVLSLLILRTIKKSEIRYFLDAFINKKSNKIRNG